MNVPEEGREIIVDPEMYGKIREEFMTNPAAVQNSGFGVKAGEPIATLYGIPIFVSPYVKGGKVVAKD